MSAGTLLLTHRARSATTGAVGEHGDRGVRRAAVSDADRLMVERVPLELDEQHPLTVPLVVVTREISDGIDV